MFKKDKNKKPSCR